MTSDLKQQNIGWIGLGILGNAIIHSLVQNGFSNINVYNRTIEKVVALAGIGIKPTYSVGEILSNCNIIFTCLSSESAFNDVIYANLEALRSSLQPKILIDLGTISPETAVHYAKSLQSFGIIYLECPVSGGKEGALAQQLTAICAGKESAFMKIKEILNCFCKNIHFVGASGNAQKLKIINNLAESINLYCASEVILLGMQMGFDVKTMLPVLSTARGRSAYMQLLLERLDSDNGDVAVTLDVRMKDLLLAEKLIEQSKLKTKLSDITIDFFTEVKQCYGGNQDQTKCFDYFKFLNDEKLKVT